MTKNSNKASQNSRRFARSPPEPSFCEGVSGDLAKCLLFSQANKSTGINITLNTEMQYVLLMVKKGNGYPLI